MRKIALVAAVAGVFALSACKSEAPAPEATTEASAEATVDASAPAVETSVEASAEASEAPKM